MTIPVRVRELCDGCFKGCKSLRRVAFCSPSSLERIGVEAFGAILDRWGKSIRCSITKICIPDSVRELCDGCFRGCSSLRHVTFGSSPSLERIGIEAFGVLEEGRGKSTPCGIVEISIPNSVRELGDGCFKGCKSLRRVTFGSSSSLERIGFHAFPITLQISKE